MSAPHVTARPAPLPPVLVFARPSRSSGRPHRVVVNARTLRPLSCSCQAGQRGIVCWAALEVAADECLAEAVRRHLEATRVLKLATQRRETAERVLAYRAEQRRRLRRVA